MPDPSKALWEGVRALEEIDGVRFLGEAEPKWTSGLRRWILHVALTANVAQGGPIPETTNWHFLISDSYPMGSISVFPSEDGGITHTFPHQHYNGSYAKEKPWRAGNICPETPTASLRHLGFTDEPREAATRLAWFVRRSLAWIELASRGTLSRNGHPFELPDYPARSTVRVAFSETAATLRTWNETTAQSGYATLHRLLGDGHQTVVRSFADRSGKTILDVTWGRFVEEGGREEPIAAWIRVPRVVVMEPWQAPYTWSELAVTLRTQGIDLWEKLKDLAPGLRDQKPPKKARRPPHLLLIGFPIPEVVKGRSVRMHWLSIELPALSVGKRFADGFRRNERGWWTSDRQGPLADDQPVRWAKSESWAAREIGSRGYLSATLRTQKAVLIGAGALGSALAEILVRAGLQHLTILDPDDLHAGNLVRHTLLLDEIEGSKAIKLAERLNKASPHAKVGGLAESFPPPDGGTREACAEADLVIDCTADDDVIRHLQDFSWKNETLLATFSLSYEAARLYCFAARGSSFPAEAFRETVDRWIDTDRPALELENFPREGVGCWHPVFPARIDDIWLMAGIAAKFLVEAASCHLEKPRFSVYEQETRSGGTFDGVRRRSGHPDEPSETS